jgi:hypothetical protein
MTTIGKIITITGLAVVAFVGAVGGKWYHTTALEPIDPQRGIYGMNGLEIWIDLNAMMPGFAREWACKTLLDRESAVLGGQSIRPPHSCQADFGTAPDVSTYDTVAESYLAQVTQGASTEAIAAIRSCMAAKMAAAVTTEEIAVANSDPMSPELEKVSLASAEAARVCKEEAGQ